MNALLQRTVVAGIFAGTAAVIVVSVAGRRRAGSYPAPLNATSHIVWGNEAAQRDEWSAKYTGVGASLHYASAVFWAALYELLPGPAPARALATAATAYVVDYHVVPRRLTPGWEKRISGRALAAAYGALAIGLFLSSFLEHRRT